MPVRTRAIVQKPMMTIIGFFVHGLLWSVLVTIRHVYWLGGYSSLRRIFLSTLSQESSIFSSIRAALEKTEFNEIPAQGRGIFEPRFQLLIHLECVVGFIAFEHGGEVGQNHQLLLILH